MCISSRNIWSNFQRFNTYSGVMFSVCFEYPHDFQPTFHTADQRTLLQRNLSAMWRTYRIPCKDCDCAYTHVYVGQTKRLFGVRLKEHQKAVFTGDSEKSALAEHVLKTGYAIDWSNATLLTCCQFLDQCLLLELWYIQNQQSGLNREQGPLPPLLYRTLMGRHLSCNVTFHLYCVYCHAYLLHYTCAFVCMVTGHCTLYSLKMTPE